MLRALAADEPGERQQQREARRIAREQPPVAPEVGLVVRVGRLAGRHAGGQQCKRPRIVEHAAVAQIVGEGEEGELVAGQIPGRAALESARGDHEREQDEPERDAPGRLSRISVQTTEPPEGWNPSEGAVVVRPGSCQSSDRSRNAPLGDPVRGQPSITGRRTLKSRSPSFFTPPSLPYFTQ